MSRRFVILCHPRTGSYLLTDILNRQNGVICHEEIFKRNRVELEEQYLEKLGLTRNDMEKRDADPLTYLESVYSISPDQVTGFKIFPFENEQILPRLIHDKNTRKVILVRNPVQSHISALVARESGAWTKTHHSKPGKDVRVKFLRGDFFKRLNQKRRFFERIMLVSKLEPGNPYHIIDYSELKDPTHMQRLADYLEIQSWNGDVIPKYNKQITKPYADVVENWEEALNMFALLGVNENSTFLDFMRSYNRVIYPD